jgi:hypothetical protein
MNSLSIELFDHICRKAGRGIPYPEAVQLMLWAYCTSGILPRQFRATRLARQDLAKIFCHLSNIGKVVVEKDPDYSRATCLEKEIMFPEHWEGVIAQLLENQIKLDESFPAHAGNYL